MDDFNYKYYPGTNRLREVKPVNKDKVYNSGPVRTDNIVYRNVTLAGNAYVPSGETVEVKALENINGYPNFESEEGTDFWAHIMSDEGTYQYDAIGNLILDQDEGVQIEWTQYGKVRTVHTKGDSIRVNFRYDAAGNRVEKKVTKRDTVENISTTRYLRDPNGRVMAIYNDTLARELPIYGSRRLGSYSGKTPEGSQVLGRRIFELSNHLGNILSVISDNVSITGDSGVSIVIRANDYYPFGLEMKGRVFQDSVHVYPYGFNGKEKGNEITGSEWYSFEFREYDPRIGRFKSIDPMANHYPFQSPYAFAGNNPVALIDILGLGPGDPKTHKVVKGDNLTKISKKYGVSVDDIVTMNKIDDKNKIKVGQELIVNPEANFSKNPWTDYNNNENPDGPEVKLDDITNVGTSFVTGMTYENIIVTDGEALKSIQNWAEVKTRVQDALNKIMEDNKAIPGEVVVRTFRAGKLPENIEKGLIEAFVSFLRGEDPWKNNSQNSPIHVLGSFQISVRVNANGTTATVCVYDSKTLRSGSDGNLSKELNRSRDDGKITKMLTNTYQRYLWNTTVKK